MIFKSEIDVYLQQTFYNFNVPALNRHVNREPMACTNIGIDLGLLNQ